MRPPAIDFTFCKWLAKSFAKRICSEPEPSRRMCSEVILISPDNCPRFLASITRLRSHRTPKSHSIILSELSGWLGKSNSYHLRSMTVADDRITANILGQLPRVKSSLRKSTYFRAKNFFNKMLVLLFIWCCSMHFVNCLSASLAKNPLGDQENDEWLPALRRLCEDGFALIDQKKRNARSRCRIRN